MLNSLPTPAKSASTTRSHCLIKPAMLMPGDIIAATSPSWGGASVFPHRYQAGKKQLEEAFNVRVIETPNALKSAEELAANPKLRADDLMWAFKKPEVKAIVSIIGGDDSVRLLPYIDYNVIAANPKIFMGYSDATSIHFCCYRAGLSSIYGPTMMAGFGEGGGLFSYMRDSVAQTLFSKKPIGLIKPNKDGWTDDEKSVRWSVPEDQVKRRPLKPSGNVKVLQGSGKVRGHLLGGCIEVLEMLKGTEVWPTRDQWEGAILFLETSEEGPSKSYVVRCLRNYAATGILERVKAVIVGRPANVTEDKITQYEDAVYKVAVREYGLTHLTIMGQMDFGHTDPMFLLPYGAQAEIDAETASFSILDSATV